MALQSGMQQAIGLAHRPQEDEVLQRKLWLAIAHHLIRTAATAADQHPVRTSTFPHFLKLFCQDVNAPLWPGIWSKMLI